jgi:hypothetical protein
MVTSALNTLTAARKSTKTQTGQYMTPLENNGSIKYMEVLTMKKYNEILKHIARTRDALKNAEEKEKQLAEALYSEPDMLRRREIKSTIAQEITENQQKILDLKIAREMLKNNAKRALFSEVAPVLVEILKKYSGKAYGKKTREKISAEFKTRTGCRCYICNSYGDSKIYIYPNENGYDIEIYTRDFKILNAENRIQAPTVEQLALFYVGEYIENIPAATKAMKKAYKKAAEKQAELEKLCTEFNRYAVEGIKPIYKNQYIYERFTL